MKTEKELLMFYQSTLRNIGLFTTVSLSMLSYSRFYRGKSRIYNISFILISLVILALASYMSRLLIIDIEKLRTANMMMIKKWIPIPYALIVINTIVTFFGVYTLYREIKRN